eukprot:COSAG01_NODE_1161_length_11459_cov_47.466549_17_plen_110_part_00
MTSEPSGKPLRPVGRCVRSAQAISLACFLGIEYRIQVFTGQYVGRNTPTADSLQNGLLPDITHGAIEILSCARWSHRLVALARQRRLRSCKSNSTPRWTRWSTSCAHLH